MKEICINEALDGVVGWPKSNLTILPLSYFITIILFCKGHFVISGIFAPCRGEIKSGQAATEPYVIRSKPELNDNQLTKGARVQIAVTGACMVLLLI